VGIESELTQAMKIRRKYPIFGLVFAAVVACSSESNESTNGSSADAGAAADDGKVTTAPDSATSDAPESSSIKPALAPNDLEYLGSVVLQTFPSGAGDGAFGRGFTFMEESDGLYFLVGVWNPKGQVNKWKLPWDGSQLTTWEATYIASLWTVPVHEATLGLHWDPSSKVLYANGTLDYDTDHSINETMSVNVIDEATGKLKSKGFFTFEDRADRYTSGSVTALPDWFRAASGCGSLAVT